MQGTSMFTSNSVKAIKITESMKDAQGKKREIFFLNGEGQVFSEMVHYTDSYPSSYKGRTVTFPEGYELLGYACDFDTDYHIKTLGFTIWKPPNFDEMVSRSSKSASRRTGEAVRRISAN